MTIQSDVIQNIIIQYNIKGSEAQTRHQVGQSAHLQLQTGSMLGTAKGEHNFKT
jgi:hypothetical protein